MRIALEEVLGDRRPPDLSARILEALDQAESSSPEQLKAGELAVQAATQHMAQENSPAPARSPKATPASLNSSRQSRDWTTIIWSSAALVLAISLSVASIIAIAFATRPPETAQTGRESDATQLAGSSNSPNDSQTSPIINSNRLVTPSGNEDEPRTGVQDSVAAADDANATSESSENPESTQVAQAAPSWVAPWAHQQPLDLASSVSLINSGLQDRWILANVQPAAGIDDQVWAERAFIALIGRRPDAYELVEFESGNVDRAAWVRHLTESEKYRPLFAQTWAARISKHLLNRSAPNHHLVAPEAFQAFLAERIASGVGLDLLVEELLTAEGELSPSQDDFNPAVSYLVALDDGKGVAATQSVLEKFWGVNARCAVCHDHEGAPSLTQAEFWSTNAHLRQMVVEGNQESGLRLKNVDFLGELGDPEHVAVFYETPQRELIATFPRFVEGVEFPESGRVDQFDRRRVLGNRIVTDSRFPETLVDWTWAQILEFPLGTVADARDVRKELAMAFAADGFRLDHLASWIVLSEAFNRSEDTTSQFASDSPWLGSPALFSRHYASLPSFESPNQALARLEKAYEEGISGILAFRSGQGSTEPARGSQDGLANVDREQGIDWKLLEGWNATPALSAQLNHIVTSPLSVRQKVEHLYLLALGSTASQEQLVRCERLIEASDEPLSVYRDLWFALSHCRSAR